MYTKDIHVVRKTDADSQRDSRQCLRKKETNRGKHTHMYTKDIHVGRKKERQKRVDSKQTI